MGECGMIVLVEHTDPEKRGTMKIADGDHITPQLLKDGGCRFPTVEMRFTFKNGPYFGPSGAALVTVERNSDWGGTERAPRGTPANP